MPTQNLLRLLLLLMLMLRSVFGADFEVYARFFCWCLAEAMKFNLGRESEATVGQDFEVYVYLKC